MIKTFKDTEAEKVFGRQFSRKLPQDIQLTANRKLWMLDAATTLEDLKIPPSNCLEALSGDRKGLHGIRINRQWRICFRWHEGNAFNVEIVDYH
jgi:toxin HigB-1